MLGHANPNTCLLNGLWESYRVNLFNKQVMLGWGVVTRLINVLCSCRFIWLDTYELTWHEHDMWTQMITPRIECCFLLIVWGACTQVASMPWDFFFFFEKQTHTREREIGSKTKAHHKLHLKVMVTNFYNALL